MRERRGSRTPRVILQWILDEEERYHGCYWDKRQDVNVGRVLASSAAWTFNFLTLTTIS